MLFKGFRFGMILQFAVGPIALFIFQVAVNSSFIAAFTGCVGVALVDLLYIVLAIIGIGKLLEKYSGVKNVLKYFGGIVLVVFGLSIFLSAVGISILPSISAGTDINNVFLKSIILTISSPLTIIFWAGVFSAKLAEEKMDKKEMYVFGMGAVCSTLFFLTLISGAGVFANSFLSGTLLKVLNSIVGIIIILFGIKTMVKKPAADID